MVAIMARFPHYDRFIFLSAGPIGDHMVLLDVAEQFRVATGAPSTIIVKHPNRFIDELALGYRGRIELVPFPTVTGRLRLAGLVLSSVVRKNCFVLMFPIPAPRYLKLFAWFVRFLTWSRVIGVTIDDTRSFPLGTGYKSWLGESNTVQLQAEGFSETANKMLELLGYARIPWTPTLPIVDAPEVLSCLGVQAREYVVFHVSSSGFFRSLPADRWNNVIRGVLERTALPVVFSGSKGDREFIESCLGTIPRDRIIVAAGETGTQELLTLYKEAKVCVTVQTGNGLIINMLHVPTVIVNIKGTAMFDYSFNKLATNLYSTQDCTCNPFETECTLLPYKGKFYMACLFNIQDAEIIDAIVRKTHEERY